MPQIVVKNLVKEFVTAVKNPDWGFVHNLVKPEKKRVRAVDGISFTVEKGESLAFIGPNGAGKSTTIKMLTGILYPSSGEISVAGFNPHAQRRQLAMKIGTLFGQRSQLIPNLPVVDSFELFGAMYEMAPAQVKRRQKELIDILDLSEFADRPIRKLSLGQRMRAEIAVALLHRPPIIFLDEPTIGLDIVAKKSLREVLTRLNKEEGVTLFLTSHDAGDIEALCERTIVVNHGQIIVDEKTEALKRKYFTLKHVRADIENAKEKVALKGVKSIKRDGEEIRFAVETRKQSLNDILRELFEKHEVTDIDVTNPSLEEVIEAAYGQQR